MCNKKLSTDTKWIRGLRWVPWGMPQWNYIEIYKLKTKIENYVCYNDLDNNIQIDSADVIVFVILLSLLVLNIIGSLYDEYWNRSEGKYKIS